MLLLCSCDLLRFVVHNKELLLSISVSSLVALVRQRQIDAGIGSDRAHHHHLLFWLLLLLLLLRALWCSLFPFSFFFFLPGTLFSVLDLVGFFLVSVCFTQNGSPLWLRVCARLRLSIFVLQSSYIYGLKEKTIQPTRQGGEGRSPWRFGQ